MASTSVGHRASPFLNLPLELREEIYRHVISDEVRLRCTTLAPRKWRNDWERRERFVISLDEDDKPYNDDDCYSYDSDDEPITVPKTALLRLLKLSRQIRTETLNLLRQTHSPKFSIRARHLPEFLYMLDKHVSLVKRLELYNILFEQKSPSDWGDDDDQLRHDKWLSDCHKYNLASHICELTLHLQMESDFTHLPKSGVMHDVLIRYLLGLGGPFQTVHQRWENVYEMPLEDMDTGYKRRIEDVKDILSQHLG
jgi:hypothetical protein